MRPNRRGGSLGRGGGGGYCQPLESVCFRTQIRVEEVEEAEWEFRTSWPEPDIKKIFFSATTV